jgi:hypothetical protein
MEAKRLIGVSRHTLAQSRAVPEMVAEAWQIQALAQAIGGWLASSGPLELKSEARELSEIGARGCGALDHPGVGNGGVRAAQLSEVDDVRAALIGLGVLLGEVGIALVGGACGTEEEGLYWQCIEAIDAADESSERVRGMLRKLAERDAERESEGESEWEPDVEPEKPDHIIRDPVHSAHPAHPARPAHSPHPVASAADVLDALEAMGPMDPMAPLAPMDAVDSAAGPL